MCAGVRRMFENVEEVQSNENAEVFHVRKLGSILKTFSVELFQFSSLTCCHPRSVYFRNNETLTSTLAVSETNKLKPYLPEHFIYLKSM